MTSASSTLSAAHAYLLSRGYRTRLLLLLLAMGTLTFVDRAVLTAVAQPLKLDLGFTDGQLGLLQGLSFALLYATLGVPIGRLAERYRRPLILAIAITVFSVATMLCGLASSFLQLFLLRMTVGVGEAGFMSPASSLVADHYPAERRASAMSIMMLGSPFGNAIGAMAGGWMAQHWGWRTTFFTVGAPGLVVAVLLIVLLREPPRGLADGVTPERRTPEPLTAVMRIVFAKPAYVHTLLGAVLATFGLVAIGQFQMIFLIRSYHLSLTVAGMIQGLSVAASLTVGTLLGGIGSDLAARRDRRWSMWFPAIGVVLAGIFYATAFLSHSLTITVVMVLLGGTALIVFYTPSYALAQNVVGPRMRATSVAIIAMCCGLLGSGLGPTWLGISSDLFARHIGGPSASADGMRYALATVNLVFAWAALHFVLAARTLRDDLYRVPETTA